MKLTYTLTKEDFSAYTRHVWRWARQQRPMLNLQLIIRGVAVVAVFGLIAFSIFHQEDFVWNSDLAFACGFIFFAIAWLMLGYYQNVQIYYYPIPDSDMFQEQSVIVSDEGITIISEDSQVDLPWHGFYFFDETKEHFFLRPNSALGYIIPKWVFATEQQMNDWRAFCDDRLVLKSYDQKTVLPFYSDRRKGSNPLK